LFSCLRVNAASSKNLKSDDALSHESAKKHAQNGKTGGLANP